MKKGKNPFNMKFRYILISLTLILATISGSAQINDTIQPENINNSSKEEKQSRNISIQTGTEKTIKVNGQEHTFEAVYIENNEENAVIRTDGRTESIEIREGIHVSGSTFKTSKLEKTGETTGKITLQAIPEGNKIEIGKTKETQDQTPETSQNQQNTEKEDKENTKTAETSQQILEMNKTLQNLAKAIEQQQNKIESLENRVEQLETQKNKQKQETPRTKTENNNQQERKENNKEEQNQSQETQGILTPLSKVIN